LISYLNTEMQSTFLFYLLWYKIYFLFKPRNRKETFAYTRMQITQYKLTSKNPTLTSTVSREDRTKKVIRTIQRGKRERKNKLPKGQSWNQDSMPGLIYHQIWLHSTEYIITYSRTLRYRAQLCSTLRGGRSGIS
jgi:hypothetical protein